MEKLKNAVQFGLSSFGPRFVLSLPSCGKWCAVCLAACVFSVLVFRSKPMKKTNEEKWQWEINNSSVLLVSFFLVFRGPLIAFISREIIGLRRVDYGVWSVDEENFVCAKNIFIKYWWKFLCKFYRFNDFSKIHRRSLILGEGIRLWHWTRNHPDLHEIKWISSVY